jgi:hypothetical protein
MQVIKKGKLLTAMKKILLEYKNGTHKANLDDCALCKLYYKYNNDEKHQGHGCHLCPMFTFFTKGDMPMPSRYDYPCMKRNCEPIDCDGCETATEIKRVIEFYKEVIKVIKTMSADQLNKVDAFKFLIKIDKKIYWKDW